MKRPARCGVLPFWTERSQSVLGFQRPVNRTGLPQNEPHVQNSSMPRPHTSHQTTRKTDFLRVKKIIGSQDLHSTYFNRQLSVFKEVHCKDLLEVRQVIKSQLDSLLWYTITRAWSLFLFRWHSTWEPASVVCDEEQCDLLQSAGPRRTLY